MSSTRALVRAHVYFDSITLANAAAAAAAQPGVEAAAAVLATDGGRQSLAEQGLLAAQALGAGPNDLVVAARAATAEQAEAALATALAVLDRPSPVRAAPSFDLPPRSMASALRRVSDAPLAVISVPGPYAAAEAFQALHGGLHVFLFSDHVPVEQEVALKRLAERRGLLLMGPEAGTAIVDGLGLGFANAVRGGEVGLVGASGSGLQEVSILLHRLGQGVSQVIGTGARDLSAEVGGLMTRRAIHLLSKDPYTRRIVLVSKPPSPEVARQALRWLAEADKPSVACFLDEATWRALDRDTSAEAQAWASGPAQPVHVARTLEQAAFVAAGQPPPPPGLDADLQAVARAEASRLAPGQEMVVGLFSGGSLADEAALVLGGRARARIWDLGADKYTLGRPHPIIDPTLRVQRLFGQAEDPRVAVVLLDVVLGYGAHPDPAAVLAPAIVEARRRAEQEGRHLAVVAHLVAADQDPQDPAAQAGRLSEAGVVLAPTNAAAARLAAAIAASSEG